MLDMLKTVSSELLLLERVLDLFSLNK
ncbi:hypothetical protein NC652_021939 [Populus alba x Populus x berolinensis]|nr:hypothetical protein NC652_021939 [Populus alba x Populus x berolinensis]